MEYLDKLHKVEIEILNEIVRICDKHNITYYLAGGTLLGAVRHKGFIPWDDDVDIIMTRKDYHRFLKICETELDKEKYFLDCYKTNKHCWNNFAKVRKNNTIFLEREVSTVDTNHGIWVDIFIWDNVGKKIGFIEKFKKKCSLYIRTLCDIKNNVSNYNKSKIKYGILKFISLFFTNRFLNRLLNGILSMNKDDNSFHVSTFVNGPIEKDVLERSRVIETVELEFEGKLYKCPKDYDYYLTNFYGDYMTLPPVEKRKTHRPLLVKFEDGEEYRNENIEN